MDSLKHDWGNATNYSARCSKCALRYVDTKSEVCAPIKFDDLVTWLPDKPTEFTNVKVDYIKNCSTITPCNSRECRKCTPNFL